jgi:hypothetical protein
MTRITVGRATLFAALICASYPTDGEEVMIDMKILNDKFRFGLLQLEKIP